MFDRFTDKAIKTIMLAQEEARRLRFPQVGPEHVLLGILGAKGSITDAIFKQNGVRFFEARRVVEEITGRGPGVPWTAFFGYPFSSETKRVLELSWEEARNLKDSFIATEHLLLGIIRADYPVTVSTFKKNERSNRRTTRIPVGGDFKASFVTLTAPIAHQQTTKKEGP